VVVLARLVPGSRAAALCAGALVACAREPVAPVLPPPTREGHYVTVDGSPGGTGAGDSPWDLGTALAGAGGRIGPGDTVWIRQGVYRGAFGTDLAGIAGSPIIFRAYPGERATIDGALDADGAYLTFWGLEIRQSFLSVTGEPLLRADTREGRFINLVLHDSRLSGVSFIKDRGEGVELYGCLIYNNGSNENVDHGIYAHNQTAGTKTIADNVVFSNFARGIQVYADEDLALRGVRVDGNVAFNNGSISASSTPVNLLVSGQVPTAAIAVTGNLLYASPGTDGIGLRLGDYGADYNGDILVEGNYAAGGAAGLQMRHRWTQAVVRGNTFAGSAQVVQTGGALLALGYEWTGNRYHRDPAAAAWEHETTDYDFAGWKAQTGLGGGDEAVAALPGAAQVFVRPNHYEAGRAHVVVYNWPHSASVAVDLSAVLAAGDAYEIRNVQDVWGAPVVAGTFDGAPVTIPMGGVAPPAPIGRATPRTAPRTGPEFDVFLVTTRDG
jgi:hypothetical protein